MARSTGFLIASILTVSAASPTPAQSPSQTPVPTPPAQNLRQSPPDAPTLRVTSTLVFLDVTVLDKKNRPVVTGLTRDDFTITEDKKPQTIFSFEAPQEHFLSAKCHRRKLRRKSSHHHPGPRSPQLHLSGLCLHSLVHAPVPPCPA